MVLLMRIRMAKRKLKKQLKAWKAYVQQIEKNKAVVSDERLEAKKQRLETLKGNVSEWFKYYFPKALPEYQDHLVRYKADPAILIHRDMIHPVRIGSRHLLTALSYLSNGSRVAIFDPGVASDVIIELKKIFGIECDVELDGKITIIRNARIV